MERVQMHSSMLADQRDVADLAETMSVLQSHGSMFIPKPGTVQAVVQPAPADNPKQKGGRANKGKGKKDNEPARDPSQARQSKCVFLHNMWFALCNNIVSGDRCAAFQKGNARGIGGLLVWAPAPRCKQSPLPCLGAERPPVQFGACGETDGQRAGDGRAVRGLQWAQTG